MAEVTRLPERAPELAPPVPPQAFNAEAASERLRSCLYTSVHLPHLENLFSEPWPPEAHAVLPSASTDERQVPQVWADVVAWALLDTVARIMAPSDPEKFAVWLFDQARLRHALADCWERLGCEGEARWKAVARIRFAFAHVTAAHHTRTAPGPSASHPLNWLHDPEIAWLIGTHDYQGVRYFNKEEFEQLVWWSSLRPLMDVAIDEMALITAESTSGGNAPAESAAGQAMSPEILAQAVRSIEEDIRWRCRKAAEAGYRIEALLSEGDLL